MIVSVESSRRKMKRFKVIMDDGREFHFGYDGGDTYIDHRERKKRQDYWARHMGNPIEKRLIDNLVPSPALFSAYLLWGPYQTIEQNVRHLNGLWKPT
jgi:hypothetical protein